MTALAWPFPSTCPTPKLNVGIRVVDDPLTSVALPAERLRPLTLGTTVTVATWVSVVAGAPLGVTVRVYVVVAAGVMLSDWPGFIDVLPSCCAPQLAATLQLMTPGPLPVAPPPAKSPKSVMGATAPKVKYCWLATKR